MEELDPQAVALTKAIRQHESGGDFNAKGKSGESGAYQFTAPTWKGYAKEILGDENAEMTPQNQNKVAYTKIKKWKDEGKNVGQIASMWNAGENRPDAYLENNIGTNQYGVHYDTPAYAKSIADLYQQYKGEAGTNNETPQTERKTFTESIPSAQPNNSKSGFLGTNPNDDLYGKVLNNNVTRGIEGVGNLLTGGGAGELGNEVGTSLATIGEKVKGLLGGQDNSKYIASPDVTKALIGGLKTGLGAFALEGAGALPGLLKKSSALAEPEIATILKGSIGKGETLADLSRQDAIEALGNRLKEMPVTEAGGETEKLIMKALKELNPTSAEKQSYIKTLLKGGYNLAKSAALYKVFGDTLGGLIHKVTP